MSDLIAIIITFVAGAVFSRIVFDRDKTKPEAPTYYGQEKEHAIGDSVSFTPSVQGEMIDEDESLSLHVRSAGEKGWRIAAHIRGEEYRIMRSKK